jgi:glucose-6-phosphate 1-dehydrogenase
VARKAPDRSKVAPKAAPAPACIMVIFGAAGDLAKRLLVPALYNLEQARLLSDRFKVLGVDHSPLDDASLRTSLGGFLHTLARDPTSEFGQTTIDEAAWKRLAASMFYQVGDFEDDASYQALAGRLASLAGGNGGSVLFYLAVAPRFFADIVERLARAGLTKAPKGCFRRVVIEKPFGVDLASARALNRRITRCLTEDQIFRIDHFLGKETVRNIMVTRFGNGVFEPLWNRLHIDSVQITAAETVGVELRGAYYDQAGALRDMVPNHLFQLLAMVAMEPPNTFEAEDVRVEKSKVMEAIRVQSLKQAAADCVRGQYTAGKVAGRKMAAYRAAPKVARKSRTETFVALKLAIDNWRWAGVPFYLRTGKAMSDRDTEIAIQFKAAPRTLFQELPGGGSTPNVLVLQIQPKEGISLLFEAKCPGPDVTLADVRMDFCYADWFKAKPATGYETLIYDCLTGEQTLFKRADEIEYSWRAVMPFLEAWKKGGEVYPYAAGEDGPRQAEELLARDGRSWRPVGT